MSKPQVTLTFAGDATKLESAFTKVGQSARSMESEVGKASKGVADSSDGFDKVGEAADNVDTKAMGFRDTLTGLQDTMKGTAMLAKGPSFEGFLTLGAGIGDLGSGFYNFLIPSMKAFSKQSILNVAQTARQTAVTVGQKAAMLAGAVATNVMTVAQKALNLAMRMNPIGLVITAITLLVAGFILAYKKSDTFRAIVQGAMRGVQVAFGWVSTAAGKVWEWFRTIAPKIGGALKTVASIITAPFRAAFSAVRSAWNSTVGGKGFTVPDWVPSVGGKSFRIPYFHTGGIMPGAPGTEGLAMLQAGERITPAHASGGGATIVMTSDGSQLGELLLRVLKQQVRIEGGAKAVFNL